MEILLQPESWIALLTLTFLEVVLGIDNIIFISIVSNKLPKEQQARARNIGLSLALFFRIGLLLGIKWIIGFSNPLFSPFDHPISGRDIILAAGGLFLIAKSIREMNQKLEPNGEISVNKSIGKSLVSIIIQIILLDIIFSFDSILTAIGLVDEIILIVIAVIIALFIMMSFAGKISNFIAKHPSLEILALSFLILIGFTLLAESLGHHIPKGYIYFAMFFSLGVEIVSIRTQKKNKSANAKK